MEAVSEGVPRGHCRGRRSKAMDRERCSWSRVSKNQFILKVIFKEESGYDVTGLITYVDAINSYDYCTSIHLAYLCND